MDDLSLQQSPNSSDDINYHYKHFFSSYDQSQNLTDGIEHDYLKFDEKNIPFGPSLDSFPPSSSANSNVESPEHQDSDPMLKLINQILNEEGMEEKPSMFDDPLALRATEKSLYEVIGQPYPPSPYDPSNQMVNSPDSLFGNSSDYNNSTNSTSSPIDLQWIADSSSYNLQDSLSKSNIQLDPFETHYVLQNIFSDSESVLQFKRGMEEANKFLPTTNPLIIDLDKYELPNKSEEISPDLPVKVEKNNMDHYGLNGRKHQYQEDNDSAETERINKQSAVYTEDDDLSEMFDQVLLIHDPNCGVSTESSFTYTKLPISMYQQNVHSNRGKNGYKMNENTGEVLVDLRSLLISCAQSVAYDDRKTTYGQLRQIRNHASPTGDVNQRLASVFAQGLEARLGGTGNEILATFARKKITTAEKLLAYHAYVTACPFTRMAISFANICIGYSESEATTLHIVDFGILYGFQWPILIQAMSKLPSTSKHHKIIKFNKLRITGIEFPQAGFRPLEQIQETGSRLRKCCERFGVPFEYRAIASQNWEKIKIEDLKITKGEFLAVNCMYRFDKLLDDTVVENCPRDGVLKLVREIKPDIFVNSIRNGSYNAPFFLTRFKETLFHYSALFDMFDATLPRDNSHRMNFEQGFFGHEVINVIACEGIEIVERPETYKKWHARLLRAGFKPVLLDDEVMKRLKHKVDVGYHKDFLFDGDGAWMLQGWKGRVLYSSSCWVPA